MAAALAPVLAPRELTLYEIHDEIACLEDTLELVEDERDRAEIAAELARLEESAIRKVDNMAAYLAFGESQLDMHENEAKKHKGLRDRWKRRIERLEAGIFRVITANGGKPLRGRVHEFSLKKCPPSVDVLNESAVPAEYIRTKTETSVDKPAAKSAMQAGAVIPGLTLVTDKKRVCR